MNVYELADESTVLEKGEVLYRYCCFYCLLLVLCSHDMHTYMNCSHLMLTPLCSIRYSTAKQTLRQNRANFVKEHGGAVEIKKTMRNAGSRDIPTQSSAAPVSNNNNWGVPSTLPQTLENAQNLGVQGATSARSLMSNIPTSFGSLNPISMSQSGSDVGLDSAQRPKLSANTAQQLNEALNFASLNNGSSMSSSGMMIMQSSNNMTPNSNSSNTSNNLSLNTAELASAARMGLSDISGSSGMSTTSAQAYSALLREYSMKEEDVLMQQFLQQQHRGQESMPPQAQSRQQDLTQLTQDQVQQQFELLRQQQFIQQQQSLQDNALIIQKGQQPQLYLGLESLQNEGNVFEDLLRTYTEPQKSQPYQDSLAPLNDTKEGLPYTDQSVPLRDVYQPESKEKQPQQPSSPTYEKKDSEGSERRLITLISWEYLIQRGEGERHDDDRHSVLIDQPIHPNLINHLREQVLV